MRKESDTDEGADSGSYKDSDFLSEEGPLKLSNRGRKWKKMRQSSRKSRRKRPRRSKSVQELFLLERDGGCVCACTLVSSRHFPHESMRSFPGGSPVGT